MYRAMIVEDEPLMRQYLMTKLHEIHPDWLAAAEASDGAEAIALLQKELFDLIITDIRMAGMDGLSLTRYASINNPDTFVMILSGYDEFDYARAAVRLNVCDYLLKPLNDTELAGALTKVVNKIEVQKKRRQADSCFPMLFNDALAGRPREAMKEYYPKLYGVPEIAGKEHWGMMVFAPSLLDAARQSGTKDLRRIKHRLYDLAFHAFHGLGAMDEQGNTSVLLFVRDPLLLRTECFKSCRQLNETFLQETGISLYCGFSKPYCALEELKTAYDEALAALRLAEAGDDLFLSSDLMYAQRAHLGRLQALTENFQKAIELKNEQEISTLCYQASSILPSPIPFSSFLLLGAFLLQRLCVSEEKLLEGARLLLAETAETCTTCAACDRAYHNILSILFNCGDSLKENIMPSLLIQKVQEYLHTHFQEGVSLSMVAEIYHVTPTYLSSLFHKEVRESYSKYLLRVRMEYAAMQLMSYPSVKIYAVAQQAGYTSSKHFIHVFRNFYGKTPKEYQERDGR